MSSIFSVVPFFEYDSLEKRAIAPHLDVLVPLTIRDSSVSRPSATPSSFLISMSLRRIQCELVQLRNDPPEMCSAGPISEENLFHWAATIYGPAGTPYADGLFHLSLELPPEYPFKAPTVTFRTPIYHPNVSRSGQICLDVLYSSWSPALTVGKILLSISCLLAEPNDEHGMEEDILVQFKVDRAAFNKTAAEWTKKYAMEYTK